MIQHIDMDKEGPIRHTFRKEERLRLRTLVEGLFAGGKSFYDFPLRLNWRRLSEAELSEAFRHGVPDGIGRTQVVFTVPKRKRRHAVDRVLMRRRMREAYRLNKRIIEEAAAEVPELRTLSMAFIYMHADNADYAMVEKKMRRLLRRLGDTLTGRPAPKGFAPRKTFAHKAPASEGAVEEGKEPENG